MYYTIYKITNKLDGKFYIGKHKTKDLDDGYMGSGKLIKRAIEKYGVENFKKEVLHVFETEAEMNEAEKRLVILGEDSYNLCPGGEGGFGYINNVGLNNSDKQRELARANIAEARKHITDEQLLANLERARELYPKSGFFQKKHSEETKKKMSGPRGKYNVQKTGIKRGPYKKRKV